VTAAESDRIAGSGFEKLTIEYERTIHMQHDSIRIFTDIGFLRQFAVSLPVKKGYQVTGKSTRW